MIYSLLPKAIWALLRNFVAKNDLQAFSRRFLHLIFCQLESFFVPLDLFLKRSMANICNDDDDDDDNDDVDNDDDGVDLLLLSSISNLKIHKCLLIM